MEIMYGDHSLPPTLGFKATTVGKDGDVLPTEIPVKEGPVDGSYRDVELGLTCGGWDPFCASNWSGELPQLLDARASRHSQGVPRKRVHQKHLSAHFHPLRRHRLHPAGKHFPSFLRAALFKTPMHDDNREVASA